MHGNNSDTLVLYRRRLKYLPRYLVGTKRRVSTGFSVDPDVLDKAREKAGRAPLSSIIEALLDKWVKGEVTLEGAQG